MIMATEYMLSYTAAEIDEKLGKIDNMDEQVVSAVEAYLAANPVTSVYIGSTPPANGELYWLDTSDGASEGGGEQEPPEVVTYSVTNNLTATTSDNTTDSVNEGGSYSAVLTANEGYVLSNISVTMGGEDITRNVYSNGTIYIASVSGDIVITAVATEIVEGVTSYTITNTLTNMTSDNPALSVEENAEYTARLTVVDGYELYSVTVKMDGVNITDSVYADGVITIPAVTGDIVITAIATTPNGNLLESNIIEFANDGSFINISEWEALNCDTVYLVSYSSMDTLRWLYIQFRYTQGMTKHSFVEQSLPFNQSNEADGTYVTELYTNVQTQEEVSKYAYVAKINLRAVLDACQALIDNGEAMSAYPYTLKIGDGNVRDLKFRLLRAYDPNQAV